METGVSDSSLWSEFIGSGYAFPLGWASHSADRSDTSREEPSATCWYSLSFCHTQPRQASRIPGSRAPHFQAAARPRWRHAISLHLPWRM